MYFVRLVWQILSAAFAGTWDALKSVSHSSIDARLDLLTRLTTAIRTSFPQLAVESARKIANLWIAERDLISFRPNDMFESFESLDLMIEHRRQRDGLDSALRQIYAKLSEVIAGAGLTSHEGWAEQDPLNPSHRQAQKSARVPRPVCTASMTQWSVGQGGFWTTSGAYNSDGIYHRDRTHIGDGGTRWFELVYDCGSSTPGGLDHALKTYRPRSGKVDYLFISHLDADHTSGLDTLLEQNQVDTVVMPFLSPSAALLTAARLAAHDALNDITVELLTRPGTYLTERRKVRRVVLVQSAPENDQDPEARGAPDAPPDRPDRNRNGESLDIIDPPPFQRRIPNPFARTEVASHATTFWLVGPDCRAFWQLTPYVHPFEPLRIGRFMQSAYVLLDSIGVDAGPHGLQTALHSLLASPSSRAALKRLYKSVRGDHNSVSLSLFSAPVPSRNGRPRLYVDVPRTAKTGGRMFRETERLGWMQMGDSTLKQYSYRRAWLSHYDRWLTRVGVMTVPHHGSKHNFHPDLFSAHPPVALACASQTNTYGHPAPTVARSAKVAHCQYHQVNEYADSWVTALYLDSTRF